MAADLRHSAIVSFGVHAGAESRPVVVIVVILDRTRSPSTVVKGRFPTMAADLRHSAIVSFAWPKLGRSQGRVAVVVVILVAVQVVVIVVVVVVVVLVGPALVVLPPVPVPKRRFPTMAADRRHSATVSFAGPELEVSHSEVG